jgi:outer membrane protein assembly factor BamB
MMTSDSGETKKDDSPEPLGDRWLICPICKQPNPAGTEYCKYCWGASLHQVVPITKHEADDFAKQWVNIKKRRRIMRISFLVLAPLILVLGLGFLYIYSYTDLLFGPLSQMNSNSRADDWAMFRNNLNRSGSAATSSTQPQGKVQWSFQTGGEIHSSPALADGVVFFGSQDHKFYAVDSATGEIRWEFQTGSVINSSPAVVNAIVYFGSNDGYFYALDDISGRELWVFQTIYPVESSPAVANGRVYFGADNYYLYCLDARKGTQLWKFNTQGWVTSSPVVANGIVYVGSGDGSCYALNASDGRFRLKFYSTGGGILSSPAVNQGEVYFTIRGALYALNGKGRTWPWEDSIRPLWIQMWAIGLAPVPPRISGAPWAKELLIDTNNPVSGRTTYSDGTPIVTDANIYATGDNLVYSIDKVTHEFRWVFQTQGKIESSPSLANNTLYVGSIDGDLYAINAQNGTKLWDLIPGGAITSSPAYSDGEIYIGSNDGKMYAIK